MVDSFLALFSQSSPIYPILIIGGFLLAIYAQGARMPRLLAFAIAIVFIGTLMLLIQAQFADEFILRPV